MREISMTKANLVRKMALKSPMDQVLVVRTKRVGSKVAHRQKMTPLRHHLPLLLTAIKMMSLSKNKSVLKKNKILSNLQIKIMITIPLRILPGGITREIESQTIQKSPRLTKLITRRKSSSSRLKVQNHSRQIRDLKS